MPGEPFLPVVLHAIDATTLATVLREVGSELTENGNFSNEWSMWQQGGYLYCDMYTRNKSEIEFITRLVERTGCILCMSPVYIEISLPEWRATVPVD